MKVRFWERVGLAGMKILIALAETGGKDWVWADDMFSRAGLGRGNVYKLQELAEMGLIEVDYRRVESGRVRQFVRLTETGLKVAQHLKNADQAAPNVDAA